MGVEVRHDRPAQALLDLGALEVHADVEDAGAEAHEEEAGHDEGTAAGYRDREAHPEQADALDDGCAHERARGAEPVHDPAREGQAEDRTERSGEQGDAELSRSERQLVLEVGHSRGERREGGAVDGEGGEHRGACGPHGRRGRSGGVGVHG